MRGFPIARGRTVRRIPGSMNRTEEAYAQLLGQRRLIGEITAFWFEGIKLRLADNTFYTPDFFVMLPSGELECHETKGTKETTNFGGRLVSKPFVEDDAAVKIKLAATLYPFRFFIAFNTKESGWVLKEI